MKAVTYSHSTIVTLQLRVLKSLIHLAKSIMKRCSDNHIPPPSWFRGDIISFVNDDSNQQCLVRRSTQYVQNEEIPGHSCRKTWSVHGFDTLLQQQIKTAGIMYTDFMWHGGTTRKECQNVKLDPILTFSNPIFSPFL